MAFDQESARQRHRPPVSTLDDCIRQFMAKPMGQDHLYEIHTAPQGELVSAVLSASHIHEIVRLRDFL
jgi:hypothetical protein